PFFHFFVQFRVTGKQKSSLFHCLKFFYFLLVFISWLTTGHLSPKRFFPIRSNALKNCALKIALKNCPQNCPQGLPNVAVTPLGLPNVACTSLGLPNVAGTPLGLPNVAGTCFSLSFLKNFFSTSFFLEFYFIIL